MRTPREIVFDILDVLRIDDASNRERAKLAKIIYGTQKKAFIAGCSIVNLADSEIAELWYDAARQYELNGAQT